MKKYWKGIRRESGEINAFLGKDTDIQGTLRFQGVVRIDGRLSGEIHSEGILILGETAHVEAEIQTHTVIVSGEIHGNVHATGRIEMHPPGRVFGNIQTPVLVIHEGVIFEGHSQMAGKSLPIEEKGGPLFRKKDRPKPVESRGTSEHGDPFASKTAMDQRSG